MGTTFSTCARRPPRPGCTGPRHVTSSTSLSPVPRPLYTREDPRPRGHPVCSPPVPSPSTSGRPSRSPSWRTLVGPSPQPSHPGPVDPDRWSPHLRLVHRTPGLTPESGSLVPPRPPVKEPEVQGSPEIGILPFVLLLYPYSGLDRGRWRRGTGCVGCLGWTPLPLRPTPSLQPRGVRCVTPPHQPHLLFQYVPHQVARRTPEADVSAPTLTSLPVVPDGGGRSRSQVGGGTLGVGLVQGRSPESGRVGVPDTGPAVSTGVLRPPRRSRRAA